jgi:ZIP family zinc transporter
VLLGVRAEALRAVLGGVAIGVMSVAAVGGLLLPALRAGSLEAVLLGGTGGVALLIWGRWAVRRHYGRAEAEARAWLTFAVLFVHSLPEGLAIGAAFASSPELGLFVVLAIAIQNVPEGTAAAIPLRAAGRSPATQVIAAIVSSVPQVPGALLAWVAVDAVQPALPASLALAGTAMLTLVVAELVPTAWRAGDRSSAVAGTLAGGAAMVLVALALPSV